VLGSALAACATGLHRPGNTLWFDFRGLGSELEKPIADLDCLYVPLEKRFAIRRKSPLALNSSEAAATRGSRCECHEKASCMVRRAMLELGRQIPDLK
jgi:hypothetical protein